MSGFCYTFGLKSFIKDASSCKNPENRSSIDLIPTNNPGSFQNSCVSEIGLSDFHRMVVTVMKTSFERLKPRAVNYKDYKSFENASGFQEFIEICQKSSNYHTDTKQKFIRGNHLPFMNKTLSKAIMHRTKFRNKHLRNKTNENKKKYTKQRNYCVSLLRKSKREYCSSLDVKNITDNKTFGKTEPFLSDKLTYTQKITLIYNDKIVKSDDYPARVLN